MGHSTAPIRVRPVSGPVVAAGRHRLRIRHDALAPAGGRTRVTFLACSEGDAAYRYTEQVGMLPRGFRGIRKGREQALTFPPVGDLRADAEPVALRATSDAGLPVEYYVAYGPARIANGTLAIAELPVRARFPIAVRVVAWQFGRGIEPQVKTAAPVGQTLEVLAP
ncbi:MAG: hypothetical protein ACODAJ_13275 [Planctomycetota bacterium]